MKKNFLFIVMLLVVFSSILSAVSIAELSEESKQLVKEFAISVDQEITEINFEAVEGMKYEIKGKTPDYIIIEIDGWYYIIPTFE